MGVVYFTCYHYLVCVNDLPWQCQIVNPTNWVRILFGLSWLIIHLQGKMKLCVPTIDRRLKLRVDGVVAFVRTKIRETQTCSNDYVCTQHISIFIINQNLSF